MSFAFGLMIAVLLLILPGAVVALAGRSSWPLALGVGPALTYGVVGLAIIPFGAIGIPWNTWTALLALAIVAATVFGLRILLARYRATDSATDAVSVWPALTVAAGVILGALFVALAAAKGMPHWQSIPSNWDSVWHANTIRWILDTGQASSTHMGELRNVETHAALYYPSVFHALGAVLAQLIGAAPTTAYTLSSLAGAAWLFPLSAALLTWQLLRRTTTQWRTAGAAATAAALSASFTAVPYVEFDTASMPNMVAYGLAVPTFVLITSSLRHRDRIPLAVIALVGVFSVHITGGVVVVTFVVAWWLLDALLRPILGRVRDLITLVAIAAPALAVLLPQFLGVLQQAEVIAGHGFPTFQGRKRTLFNAIVQHTRHLNDFPIQNILIGFAAVGFVLLLTKRIWWPAAVWLVMMVSIVHSGAPFGGPVGAIIGKYSDLFYSDPRRLSAVVTLLLTPMAGLALYAATLLVVAGVRRLTQRWAAARDPDRGFWIGATAVLLTAVTVGLAWHYFPRHRYLIGEKYDRVIVDDKDLEAMAYLATLPGARETVIGDANVDGTAWMYAVAGLHPLWTHYDYPVQQGPGYHRFIFWAYADDADHDPRIAEAVKALNIRYVLTSTPVVRGFVMPDGLVSLDKSKSWAKIYDNGEARIYEWRGSSPPDTQ
ncbi:putative transmembrane protein alanine and leucine rich [uncultured Mycobacterium sp.]|uniref:Putative transmembrane protein alanine and leucine rich n=1 Tax=uncultured Mycobacterium sp. TaxID=171292 RepID=A0A1Y5P6Q8_9MYCO|nr:putative transmembrane protein alanine and leucine rich [uncultured Mycobacterium sp.]